ncbi:hypothetical protein BH11BAC4_BH11BAC4_23220 [soil metagenome]
MITNNFSKQRSNSTLWFMLCYFILCFYYFGVTMMVYMVDYPAISFVHENIEPVFEIFKQQLLFVCYIPAVLMVFSSIAFLLNAPKEFPRWCISASVMSGLVSVATTFFVYSSVIAQLPSRGFTPELQKQILPISLYLQIIPAACQVLLVFFLINIYLKDTKPVGRWLFIVVFILTFYTAGTGYVEGLVNYKFWGSVGNADWLPLRFSGSSARFMGTFLIPAFLPFLLIIPLIWLRPKPVPRYFTFIFFAAQLWIFIVTAVYFVPKIQLPLNNAYSLKLIEDLNKYDFILRGTAGLVLSFITAWMFVKIMKHKSAFM